MKCTKAQEWIALEVEGDLAEKRSARLRSHLIVCPACQEFAQEIRESQWALKSLREEAPEDAVLVVARRTALARIASERADQKRAWLAWPARPRWIYTASAAAVLMIVAAGWLALREPQGPAAVAQSPTVQTEPLAARLPETPAEQKAVSPPGEVGKAAIPRIPVARAANEPAARSGPAPASGSLQPGQPDEEAPAGPRIEVVSVITDENPAAEGSETVLLSIASSDPNVLLYWVMDDEGGS